MLLGSAIVVVIVVALVLCVLIVTMGVLYLRRYVTGCHQPVYYEVSPTRYINFLWLCIGFNVALNYGSSAFFMSVCNARTWLPRAYKILSN